MNPDPREDEDEDYEAEDHSPCPECGECPQCGGMCDCWQRHLG